MKKNNNKGFTLAELLIVVAIIAVLVAIAIPVFTSQLEKSKEATDISNIRSYYAEVTTGLLTGDMKTSSDEVNVGNNIPAKLQEDALPTTTGTDFHVIVGSAAKPVTFKQSVAKWQTAEFDIAGVKGSGKDTSKVSQWASGNNQVKYTFTLTDDGDYVLTAVDLQTAS